MTRAMTLLVLATLAATAEAQHTKRDAAKLAAEMDAILHDAYEGKPARKRHHQPPAKESASDATKEAVKEPVETASTPLVVAPAVAEDTIGAVITHAVRFVLEPAAWTPRLPKTPEEVAAHLRNLPTTPAEVNGHLRRLDAALQAHQRR